MVPTPRGGSYRPDVPAASLPHVLAISVWHPELSERNLKTLAHSYRTPGGGEQAEGPEAPSLARATTGQDGSAPTGERGDLRPWPPGLNACRIGYVETNEVEP